LYLCTFPIPIPISFFGRFSFLFKFYGSKLHISRKISPQLYVNYDNFFSSFLLLVILLLCKRSKKTWICCQRLLYCVIIEIICMILSFFIRLISSSDIFINYFLHRLSSHNINLKSQLTESLCFWIISRVFSEIIWQWDFSCR
jgi:hypothetical protein